MEKVKEESKPLEPLEIKHKIRTLTNGDRKTLTRIVKKLGEMEGKKHFISMMPSEVKLTANQKKQQKHKEKAEESTKLEAIIDVIMSVFQDAIDLLEGDVTVWFADLLDVNKDKYDELPFNIETDVLTQILDDEVFMDFFLKGLQLRKKASRLVSLFRS